MKATRRDIMALVGALISASASSKIAQAQQIRAPASAADVPGMPPGTIMTKNYVTMVARTAYVWGWPLVNQMNRRAAIRSRASRMARISRVRSGQKPLTMVTALYHRSMSIMASPAWW